jgi:3-methyladenine DNA glycosylase AlkD
MEKDDWGEDFLRNQAFELLDLESSEPKLAGILILQEHVFDSLQPKRDLPRIECLFREGHLPDWHHTDWCCVKVIGKLIERDDVEAVDILKEWVNSECLWQKRASLVSFVYHTQQHKDTVLSIADELCQDQRRFAQTAIGWTLRSLSEHEPNLVFEFLKRRHTQLTMEALKMASAKLSNQQRGRLGVTGKRKRR